MKLSKCETCKFSQETNYCYGGGCCTTFYCNKNREDAEYVKEEDCQFEQSIIKSVAVPILKALPVLIVIVFIFCALISYN